MKTLFKKVEKAIVNNNKRAIKEVKKDSSLYNYLLTETTGQKGYFATDKDVVDYKVKRLNKDLEKSLEQLQNKMNEANEAKDIKYIEVVVEWKRSRTWGANPTATIRTDEGCFNSGSITGYGYCKLSTAIGVALNQSLGLKKSLWNNTEAKDWKRSYLPYFEQGAGVGVIENQLELCGFKKVSSLHGKNFDTYYFERKK